MLSQMHDKGFLNDAQYEAAKEEPVRLAPAHETDSELAPEAVLIAKKLLLELEPDRGPRGGFTITTTIDPRLQAAARKALRENVQAYDACRYSVNNRADSIVAFSSAGFSGSSVARFACHFAASSRRGPLRDCTRLSADHCS
nr:hypothetical protein [Escherichia coli]